VVRRQPLSLQQQAQPAIAEPPSFGSQRTQSGPQRPIVATASSVADRCPVSTEDHTRPPLADVVRLTRSNHSGPPCHGPHHFLRRCLSTPHCPAWHRPAASSAACSRLRAVEAGVPRKHPCRRTWPSTCRTSPRRRRACGRHPPSSTRSPAPAGDLLLGKTRSLHLRLLLGRTLLKIGGVSGAQVMHHCASHPHKSSPGPEAVAPDWHRALTGVAPEIDGREVRTQSERSGHDEYPVVRLDMNHTRTRVGNPLRESQAARVGIIRPRPLASPTGGRDRLRKKRGLVVSDPI
jgi:hypothetical protein